MTTHEQYEDLVAAYAFETVDASERRQFEAHLPDCAACREAVADLRRVSVGLGLSVDAVEPPASLRERTIRAAIGAPRPAATSALPTGRVGRPSSAGGAVPLWWRLALAASVVLTAGMGAYAWSLNAEVDSLRDLLAQATVQSNRLRADLAAARVDTGRLTHTVTVIGAPDVLRVEMKGQAGALQSLGRAYVSGSTGVIFRATALPTPNPGRTYELWIIPPGGGKPIGAGTFGVDASGNAIVNIPMPAGVSAAAAIAVSDEPTGGSPTGGPTGPVVLMGAIS